MAIKTAYVETRSQPAKGTFPRQGPDTYVMVQVVPDGAKLLRCLNHMAARSRGIELIYCGEGYSNRSGPRSMLGRAVEQATQIANKINTTD